MLECFDERKADKSRCMTSRLCDFPKFFPKDVSSDNEVCLGSCSIVFKQWFNSKEKNYDRRKFEEVLCPCNSREDNKHISDMNLGTLKRKMLHKLWMLRCTTRFRRNYLCIKWSRTEFLCWQCIYRQKSKENNAKV